MERIRHFRFAVAGFEVLESLRKVVGGAACAVDGLCDFTRAERGVKPIDKRADIVLDARRLFHAVPRAPVSLGCFKHRPRLSWYGYMVALLRGESAVAATRTRITFSSLDSDARRRLHPV